LERDAVVADPDHVLPGVQAAAEQFVELRHTGAEHHGGSGVEGISGAVDGRRSPSRLHMVDVLGGTRPANPGGLT